MLTSRVPPFHAIRIILVFINVSDRVVSFLSINVATCLHKVSWKYLSNDEELCHGHFHFLLNCGQISLRRLLDFSSQESFHSIFDLTSSRNCDVLPCRFLCSTLAWLLNSSYGFLTSFFAWRSPINYGLSRGAVYCRSAIVPARETIHSKPVFSIVTDT